MTNRERAEKILEKHCCNHNWQWFKDRAINAMLEFKGQEASDEDIERDAEELLKWALQICSEINSIKRYSMRFPELNVLASAINDYINQINNK